jgi:hypothetical protein
MSTVIASPAGVAKDTAEYFAAKLVYAQAVISKLSDREVSRRYSLEDFVVKTGRTGRVRDLGRGGPTARARHIEAPHNRRPRKRDYVGPVS